MYGTMVKNPSLDAFNGISYVRKPTFTAELYLSLCVCVSRCLPVCVCPSPSRTPVLLCVKCLPSLGVCCVHIFSLEKWKCLMSCFQIQAQYIRRADSKRLKDVFDKVSCSLTWNCSADFHWHRKFLPLSGIGGLTGLCSANTTACPTSTLPWKKTVNVSWPPMTSSSSISDCCRSKMPIKRVWRC